MIRKFIKAVPDSWYTENKVKVDHNLGILRRHKKGEEKEFVNWDQIIKWLMIFWLLSGHPFVNFAITSNTNGCPDKSQKRPQKNAPDYLKLFIATKTKPLFSLSLVVCFRKRRRIKKWSGNLRHTNDRHFFLRLDIAIALFGENDRLCYSFSFSRFRNRRSLAQVGYSIYSR